MQLKFTAPEVKARGNAIMAIVSLFVPQDHVTAAALLALGARGLATSYNASPDDIEALFCDWVLPAFGHPAKAPGELDH